MTQDEVAAIAKRVGFPIHHPEWRKAVEEFAALVEEQAITALKERLAQPEQEPVVYVKPALDTLKHSDHCRYWDDGEFCTCGAIEYEELQFWKNKALAQRTEQEPFAIVHIKLGCLVGSHRDQNKPFPDGQYGLWPVATPPAQPQRKPLTDEQKRELIKKSELWDMYVHMGWYSAPAKSFVEKTIQLIADIEAAHGIKENT
jgi:hypothetical protein